MGVVLAVAAVWLTAQQLGGSLSQHPCRPPGDLGLVSVASPTAGPTSTPIPTYPSRPTRTPNTLQTATTTRTPLPTATVTPTVQAYTATAPGGCWRVVLAEKEHGGAGVTVWDTTFPSGQRRPLVKYQEVHATDDRRGEGRRPNVERLGIEPRLLFVDKTGLRTVNQESGQVVDVVTIQAFKAGYGLSIPVWSAPILQHEWRRTLGLESPKASTDASVVSVRPWLDHELGELLVNLVSGEASLLTNVWRLGWAPRTRRYLGHRGRMERTG